MDKSKFSQSELLELEALEIRGGSGASSTAQLECINSVSGCGNNASQIRCINTAAGCGGEGGGGTVPPVEGTPSCGIWV